MVDYGGGVMDATHLYLKYQGEEDEVFNLF